REVEVSVSLGSPNGLLLFLYFSLLLLGGIPTKKRVSAGLFRSFYFATIRARVIVGSDDRVFSHGNSPFLSGYQQPGFSFARTAASLASRSLRKATVRSGPGST